MSYVLIDGKRCYRDDVTGEVIIDNVSEETAEQRTMQSTKRCINRNMVLPDIVQNEGIINSLLTLFTRMLHATRYFLLVISVVLIVAFCVHENPDVRNPIDYVNIQKGIHLQIRSTEESVHRIEQIGERVRNVFVKKGDK